jgi:hypothetical protein
MSFDSDNCYCPQLRDKATPTIELLHKLNYRLQPQIDQSKTLKLTAKKVYLKQRPRVKYFCQELVGLFGIRSFYLN